MTQKGLAKRLGVREQQVQRYEATGYAGASLARLQAVADGLGVQIQGRILLPTTERAARLKHLARTAVGRSSPRAVSAYAL